MNRRHINLYIILHKIRYRIQKKKRMRIPEHFCNETRLWFSAVNHIEFHRSSNFPDPNHSSFTITRTILNWCGFSQENIRIFFYFSFFYTQIIRRLACINLWVALIDCLKPTHSRVRSYSIISLCTSFSRAFIICRIQTGKLQNILETLCIFFTCTKSQKEIESNFFFSFQFQCLWLKLIIVSTCHIVWSRKKPIKLNGWDQIVINCTNREKPFCFFFFFCCSP